MSAPAAKARSLPPSTMQRTSSSASSSLQRADERVHQLAPRARSAASGRFSSTTPTAPSRSTRTSSALLAPGMPRSPPAPPRRASRARASRARAPIVSCQRESRHTVQLLLRVARRLREASPRASRRARRPSRRAPPPEPPQLTSPHSARLRRGDLLAEHDDLAGAAVADEDRQPLRRAAGRHRAVLGPDVADERVVDHHREVARHLQLVAAADADAVDARDRRLADLAQRGRACP